MADLDDFFAKKDRKKSKGKKFTTTDEIAKKLEDAGKKSEKVKKPMPLQQIGTDGDENIHQTQDEDDEWKEFEEEKKDYSGLRIGNLTITEGDSEGGGCDGEEQDIMEENEAGELVPRRKVQSGPWKIVAPQSQPEPEQPVEDKHIEYMPTGGSAYLPPHLRNQPREIHSSPRMKNRTAPDINSEEFFPTLSASKNVDPRAQGRKRRDEGAFEEVRNSRSHSNRYAESAMAASGPRLSLGNKYGALSQEQS
ncbi:protein CDV3 homolog [Schistocerca americana]|uniref:protein CDV3 homolog n=1 Tax=Schistocerca americana TaxID=7009 RepID=UPI001F4FD8D6|nr:protein CDV3 homolog [Schistocerca americana]XP_047102275.1 protein CDV3 homolog isoform X1 [Schistocerca piceifrons]XP_049782179.1 protein CDV3 homolog [Schistocerca cancellata]